MGIKMPIFDFTASIRLRQFESFFDKKNFGNRMLARKADFSLHALSPVSVICPDNRDSNGTFQFWLNSLPQVSSWTCVMYSEIRRKASPFRELFQYPRVS